MSSNGGDPDDVESLPPSCKFVLRELERDGPLTRQELIERTGLSPTTVDDALRTAESRHLVLRTRKSDDLTRVVAETRQSPDL